MIDPKSNEAEWIWNPTQIQWRLVCAGALALMMAISALSFYGYAQRHGDSGLPIRQDDKKDWDYLRTVQDDFDIEEISAYLVFSGDDLLEKKNVIAMRAVVDDLREEDFVSALLWIDDIPIINVFGLADPLLPPNQSSEESFAASRKKLTEHPLTSGQLVATNGETVIVPIFFDWLSVESDEQITIEAVENAKRVVAENGASFDVGITGTVPLSVEQKLAHDRNNTKFRIIGYAIVAIVSIMLFRGILPAIVVASGAVTGIMWSLGFMFLLDQEGNPLTTAILPVLLAMVGLADGIHLGNYIRSKIREGFSNRQAAIAGVFSIGPACFLTSVTTAVGFGSLMLAESEFVKGFGKTCAIGVSVTFVAVVVLVPLLSCTRLGNTLAKGSGTDWTESSLEKFSWVIDWILRRKIAVSMIAILLTLGLSICFLFLPPDYNIHSVMPGSSHSTKWLLHCDREMGGIQFVRVVVEWDGEVEDRSAEILQVVRETETAVKSEPLLGNPLSVNNFLNSLPGDRDDLDHRLDLLELLPRQLVSAFHREDQRRTLMNIRVQDVGVAAYKPVLARTRDNFAAIEKAHPNFRVQLTGSTVLRSDRVYQIVVDLSKSLGAAAAIILVVLIIAYRSISLGLISIVPNVFPLAVTAFVLVVFDLPLDITAVCAFTVCLGIAVDDTIHYLGWYRQRKQLGAESAIRETFVKVGKPLIFTTVLMVVGFSTLLISELPNQNAFGIMACTTIGSALFGDLIFLPALLSWLEKSE